ncbi:hypothetical protein RclHR1_13740008 [Rhizophagus clarus]|uniref:Jacalin-type lectin domain-containing protein n=1 Tax=Rhizophagus clarus TaxID=94130 RepID=A0A2Z6QAY2_9GLOM|nr:hypothetical protein RclHR1_13740008 [Rhizophagus clarus]GES75951.1 hypothetical protein GLOIN_2v1542857 [Rhizophagus clarus]
MAAKTVKSQKFGGTGGISHDDISIITNAQNFSGIIASINKVDIISVSALCADTIQSVQFTYNVEVLGLLYTFQGNKYGSGNTVIISPPGGVVRGISGRYRSFFGSYVISNLVFQFDTTNYTCGSTFNPDDIDFDLPVGIIFGSSGDLVDSLGSYVFVDPGQLAATVTSSITTTVFPSSSDVISPNSDNFATTRSKSSIIVALSLTTGILGSCFLVAMGIFLWKKFHPRANAAPPLANN